MSRDWIGVYGRLLRQPKFRRLTEAGQLTLFYVWSFACDQSPEATWPSRAALGDLLEFYGRSPDAIDEFMGGGFLEVDDDGSVFVHDWDEWQYAATKAARNAWEARYMREWRRKAAEKQIARVEPDLTGPDMTRHDMTGVDNSRQHVNNNGRWKGYDEACWKPFSEAWDARGLTELPTIRQREQLYKIADARPNDLATWVRGAPRDAKPFDVVGYVLKKWQRFQGAA